MNMWPIYLTVSAVVGIPLAIVAWASAAIIREEIAWRRWSRRWETR